MDIDLSKVIAYSKDSLQSRALMRAIMLDLYPGKTREMNVLLDVYESGVPRKIKNMGSINDSQYMAYIQRIVNDYGLQEKYVIEGLDAWIDQCICEGTAAKMHKPIPNQQNNSSVSNEQPQPIKHKPIVAQSVKDVFGSSMEFEVQSYSQNPSEIVIVKYNGFEEKELIVPSYIDGKEVIGVGKEAYKGCKKVEKLIIAEGIEFIEDASFACCINLKEIILPSTLKQIGTIKNETPNKYIDGAFSETAIKSISLPPQLTYLGKRTFLHCGSLESINLPNGIKKIYNSTFQGCNLLRNVQLPDNLEEIGESAFTGCGFGKIDLPAKVKVIEEYAFSNCQNLTNIQLNEGILEIGRAAFRNCKSMEKIVIPSTVQKMGDHLFNIERNGFSTTSSKLTIYCYAGSVAIEYARKEGYQIENAAKLNS
jgi:hypothetical protein